MIGRVLATALAGFVSVTGVASGAVTAQEPAVTIRTYGDADIPPAVMTVALKGAAVPLHDAGIEIAWKRCAAPVAVTGAADCNRPLAHDELAVRFVRGPAPERDRTRQSLGDALIDTGSRMGMLATIYVDRVLWLADMARVEAHEVLGRAIAHEIGHLLLGSSQHGSHGLMRSTWSCLELQRHRRSDWVFNAREAALMRAGAATRTATKLAAEHPVWGTR